MKIKETFLPDLLGFIQGLADADSEAITPDVDLIDTGVIDSLSITQVLVFIEEQLKVSVTLEDLLLDSVRTARTIDGFYNVQR